MLPCLFLPPSEQKLLPSSRKLADVASLQEEARRRPHTWIPLQSWSGQKARRPPARLPLSGGLCCPRMLSACASRSWAVHLPALARTVASAGRDMQWIAGTSAALGKWTHFLGRGGGLESCCLMGILNTGASFISPGFLTLLPLCHPHARKPSPEPRRLTCALLPSTFPHTSWPKLS